MAFLQFVDKILLELPAGGQGATSGFCLFQCATDNLKRLLKNYDKIRFLQFEIQLCFNVHKYIKVNSFLGKLNSLLMISSAVYNFSKNALSAPTANYFVECNWIRAFRSSKVAMREVVNNSLYHNRNLSIDGLLLRYSHCPSALKKESRKFWMRRSDAEQNRMFRVDIRLFVSWHSKKRDRFGDKIWFRKYWRLRKIVNLWCPKGRNRTIPKKSKMTIGK